MPNFDINNKSNPGANRRMFILTDTAKLQQQNTSLIFDIHEEVAFLKRKNLKTAQAIAQWS